jgi:putative hydrolase of the HAD superfamily
VAAETGKHSISIAVPVLATLSIVKLDAVIFDLFGTLADFSPLAHERVLAAMADLLGVTPRDFGRAWGRSHLAQERGGLATLEETLRHMCADFRRAPDQERVAAAGALYLDFQRRTLTPRPDALPTLTALRTRGYATGLISNCPGIAADLWPASALAPLIDVAVFSCRVGLLKPDPRIYELTCQWLGVAPERCLYVGDGGSHELTGATACGMHAVLLQPSGDDSEEARLLGRQEWSGLSVSSLTRILSLVGQAA